MFQYILFDLDGTLTDPKVGITTCVQYGLQSLGIEVPNLDLLEPFIGPPLKDSFMEFYSLTSEEADRAIVKYRERFSTVGMYENEIYHGIAELLAKLKNEGRHLAIASSKPSVFVLKILEYFQIRDYFEVVVGSELDGTRGTKEEVVEEALRQLLKGTQANCSNTVMVGDRKFDIQGAKEHQIASIGVTYGYAQKEELINAKADIIVDSVSQLGETLLKPVDKRKKQSEGSWRKALNCFLPAIIYYLANTTVVLLLAAILQQLRKEGNVTAVQFVDSHSVLIASVFSGLGMLVGAGVLFRFFLMERPVLYKKLKPWKQVLALIVCSVSVAMTINIFFFLTGFRNSSSAYQDVAKTQFGVPLIIGLILYGLISPITEEIVFRGIVYNRLRKQFSDTISIVGSAVIFGAFHGNLVQAVYGTLLGVLITYFYSRYGSFHIPVLIHSLANISIFLVVTFPTAQHFFFTPISCLIFAFLSLVSIFYLKNTKKMN